MGVDRGLTLLHYDADEERITDVTGQAHDWAPTGHRVARIRRPRMTVDGITSRRAGNCRRRAAHSSTGDSPGVRVLP